MKRVIIFALALFFAGTLLGANEFSNTAHSSGKKSFFTALNSGSGWSGSHYGGSLFQKGDIVSYSSSRDWDYRADNMLRMGIAGAILFGTSFFVWITGVAICAYSFYALLGGSWSWTMLYGTLTLGAGLYIGGVTLIALGQIMFWVGLPLMIVGFVLHAVFRRKARTAMFMDSAYDENGAGFRYGLAIKL